MSTTFDPEVAYRILNAKRMRLLDESTRLLRKRIELESTGALPHYSDEWTAMADETNRLYDEASRMYDVLVYLRGRIEGFE